MRKKALTVKEKVVECKKHIGYETQQRGCAAVLCTAAEMLHSVDALTVISECEIRRNEETWGETPEKHQAIS